MHELSIALGIIDIATGEAERRAAALTAIHLKIGPLSGVVERALISAYELAREGTIAADASLVIERVPIVAHCAVCQSDQPIESMQMLVCPRCQSPVDSIVSGRELEVVALELTS